MINVKIKNYTTLKKADFDIKGLTVLRSPSNGGKSSIVNAIYAGVTAEFPPNALRWGESQAQIDLGFSDGAVTLTRTGGSSSYKMHTASVEQTYSKFGRKLPDEVTSFLNLCVISVEDRPSYLNFHLQFAPPLSLSMSHNRFVSLLSSSDLLEEHKGVSKKLSTKAYELQGSIDSFSTLLSKTQVSLDEKARQFQFLQPLSVQLGAKYKEIESIDKSISALLSLSSQLSQLQFLIDTKNLKGYELSAVDSVIDSYQLVLSKKKHVDDINVVIGLRYSKGDAIIRLDSVKHLFSMANALAYSNQVVESARVRYNSSQALIYLSNSVVSLSEVLRSKNLGVASVDNVISKGSEISDIKNKIQRLSLLSSTLSQLKSLQGSFDAKKRVIDNNLCPLCGSPLGGHNH